MYVCRVFNEFSVNPSWVQEFQTDEEVMTFLHRVKHTMFFKKIEINGGRRISSREEV
jgi:hypothetical protein